MLPAADEGTHELKTVENCDCTKGELTQSVGDEPWLLGKNGEDRRRSKRASNVHEGDDDEERARTAARTVCRTATASILILMESVGSRRGEVERASVDGSGNEARSVKDIRVSKAGLYTASMDGEIENLFEGNLLGSGAVVPFYRCCGTGVNNDR